MTQPTEERRPLIPQFTLRWLLGLMTVCALLFTIVGAAARGHSWAIGISIGMGSLVLMAVVYAFLFGGAWIVAWVVPQRRVDLGASPFRADPFGGPAAPSEPAAGADLPLEAEIVP